MFPGALYHVTARGNRRAAIFLDRRDHLIWLDKLAATVEAHQFVVHGYCLMPNHYHLLVETPLANLPDGMQMLNATFCQHFNQRHQLSGHVIQGRYHAVNVNKDAQLLAVARYICLNPVRAHLVEHPADWPWSSHCHMMAPQAAPAWLETQWLLAQFGQGPLAQQIKAYCEFVEAGRRLGHPLRKRQEPLSLQGYAARWPSTREAMKQAYMSQAYTRQQIADYFGVSTRTVSRAIK